MRRADKGEKENMFYNSTRKKKEEQYFLLEQERKIKATILSKVCTGRRWERVGRKIGI